MAGRGSRLRPHTLTIPKPLLPIAGKPIVQRLVEDIVGLYDGKVEEIAFVIGDFGNQVEQNLLEVAEGLGAKGHIFYQDEPLGTAHAIWMAESIMKGEIIIAWSEKVGKGNQRKTLLYMIFKVHLTIIGRHNFEIGMGNRGQTLQALHIFSEDERI